MRHRKVSSSLGSHSVDTVTDAGWRGAENGKLLALAATLYDAFITSDKNLQYQQHRDSLPIPVIVISTKGNMWEDIEPVIPKIEALLSSELQKEFYSVS
jgi:hypothetical protein